MMRLALSHPPAPERSAPPAPLPAGGADPLGLHRPALHEVVAARYGDEAVLTGLAAAALAGLKGRAVLWVAGAGRDHGRLSGRGLAGMGLDPGRLLHAVARKPVDALAAVEEGLRSGAVAAVVAELAEMPEPGFTFSRRLALAAARMGVPAVLLMGHRREGTTAAEARWRIAALPSAENPFDPKAPGPVRWRAHLARSRRWPEAAGQAMELEFDDETLSLRVVSGLAARPAEPQRTRGQDRLAKLLRRAG